MAQFNNLSILFFVFFGMLLSSNFGKTTAQNITTHTITTQDVVPPGTKAWCVAKPSTSDGDLRSNIEFVCQQQGFRCNIIQEGGQCYTPNTLINHASVVMNLYFQKYGHFDHSCSFLGTGLIVLTDPSYENCLYSYTQ
ncbi:hypothetical protein RND81_08G005800 [Saponaria officinalis]|uniref:X8 domain-containing protein n=1 Tax=Saponaria officinalis TaxID=3572 RepID=A0AAW1J1Y3_SAPOF